MRLLKYILIFVLVLRLVSADIVLSEVMYNPTQASDTDAEWIELYNTGPNQVDLTDYQIDGSDFDDVVLGPNQFLVVARELIDTTDEDLDSFETIWGNNDGVWDENDNFLAVDGILSLTDADTIIVTSPTTSEILTYNSTQGGLNGYTLEKIDLLGINDPANWIQSANLGGTPGYSESQQLEQHPNTLDVVVQVKNPLPVVENIDLTDDDPNPGYQIQPNYKQVKQVSFETTITDLGSTSNIKDVLITVKNTTHQLVKQTDLDNYSAVYTTIFDMQPTDLAKIYTIELTVTTLDGSTTTLNVDFEYLGLMSMTLQESTLDFGILNPGTTSNQTQVTVLNEGNVVLDLEISGDDLHGVTNTLLASNIEYGEILFQQLSNLPSIFDFNVDPGLNKFLNFRLQIPQDTQPDMYTGAITVVGVAQ